MTNKIDIYFPAEMDLNAGNWNKQTDGEIGLHPYGKLTPEMIGLAVEEPVLLVLKSDQYQSIRNKWEKTHHPFGRLLVEFARGEKITLPVQAVEGIDFIEDGAEKGLLSFKILKAIAEINNNDHMAKLRVVEAKQAADLDTLNEIGSALSTEKDLNKLLEMIVGKCQEMTWADAGSLYMIEADPKIEEDQKNYMKNKKMRFQVARNFSKNVPFRSFLVDINKTSVYGYVAITQKFLNFEDAYHIPPGSEYGWGGKAFDASIGYRTKSMLTVPMVNYRGETIGVIQLINRKKSPEIILEDPEACVRDILPFSEDDTRMVQSIASQASIAIQNAQLVESIKGLFNGFINASVKAIEARDPTTSGHSQRVSTLTVGLAEQVDRSSLAPFKDLKFSSEMIQEVRYASLLHDFGKIGVREHVLVKAKKLYPNEMQMVVDRFGLIHRTLQLESMQAQIDHLRANEKEKALVLVDKMREEMKRRTDEVEEILEFIRKCNEPTVMAQGGFERLVEIQKQTFQNWDGHVLNFLTDQEIASLSIPKGSLNEQDRLEIESHVTHTYNFLSSIPWTADLRNVAEIAYAHHEKLDGTGYPKQKKSDQIPIQSKMMTIADIYDALTAWDRPYKKAIPVERALDILREEANNHHIDMELLNLFIDAELFKLVSKAD